MPITADEAKRLRELTAAFATKSAALRALETDRYWMQAAKVASGDLETRIEEARVVWRDAHTRTYKAIDELESEGALF